MDSIENIIYSRGITNAKKKLNFITKKQPIQQKKILNFKSRQKQPEIINENSSEKKSTFIIKRKKISLNVEELSKDIEKLKILPKNSIILGKNMYYLDENYNLVDENYDGYKLLHISFPRCTKVTSNVSDKKDIPTKFLNVFGRLKSKHMMQSYDDKFHCWNSISENSKKNWKNISYNTDTLEKFLLVNNTEATLLWCHLFS